jgi:hypothetical protein
MQDKLKIFISSPLVGLRDIREYILKNEKSLGVSFSSMESFLSSPNLPKEECLEHLRHSDYVVLLIGPEYGSIDPLSGKSFTEVEYDEADKLGMPLFPFVMADSISGWKPYDVDEGIKQKHVDFFERIKIKHTIDHFLNGEELIQKIAPSIEQYKERLSKPYYPFVNYKEYFFAFIGKDKLFRQDYTIIGREKEIASIDSFIQSDKKILTIVGRGGIGKSKLIYEVAKRYETSKGECSRFLFIKENVIFDNEILKKIPSGKSVLILEDAHRYDQLLNVLALFRNSDLFDRLKLIITSRPSGSDIIRMNLNISIDSTFVENMPELQDLGRTEVEQLVGLFIKRNPALINFIANITKDCTLATVIGSKLIAEGKIDPARIKGSEEFNRLVLDKLLDEYKKALSKGEKVDNLLQYLAALGPVMPADAELIKNLGKVLDLKESETIRKIEELEAKGLLVRRGRLVRIAPDLLSDHILYRACVSIYDVPTNFVNEVYSEFPKAYIANLLANVAEIEWRVKADNKNINLLQNIWDDIYRKFLDATNYQRLEILAQIDKAAIFQPKQALKLVEIAISNPAQKQPEGDHAELLARWKHEDVLRKLPDILKKVSYHLGHLRRCCEILWELGKDDGRELNPYPDHPLRVLQNIAGYNNPQQTIAFKDCIVTFLESLSEQPDIHKHKQSIFAIINELLAKEGRYTTSNAATFTFHPYILNVKALLPLRQRVIKILEKCFFDKNNPSVVIKAFSSLRATLGYAHGSFGRVISKEEEDQWLSEQMSILEIINKGLGLNQDVALRVVVKKDLLWFEKHAHHNEIKEKVRETFTLIAEDFDFRLYKALNGNLFDFLDPEIGYRGEQEKIGKELENIAGEFLVTVKSSQKVFDKLNKALEELNAYLCDPQPGAFLSTLVTKSPDLGIFLYEHILINPNCNIAFYSSALLWPVKKYPEHTTELNKLIKEGIASNNETIILNIAHFYAWGGFLKDFSEADFHNIKSMVSFGNKKVIAYILHAISNLGQINAKQAKELLFMIEFKGDIAESICSCINEKHGIPFFSFDMQEVEIILKKLIPLHIFDSEHYHIEKLLELVASKYPDLVIAFLIERLKYSQSTKREGEEYIPFPYLGFDTRLFDITKLKDSKKYMRQIRDFAGIPGEKDTFWLPKLFQVVSGHYSQDSIEVLSEWLKTKEMEKLIGISLLLREASSAFLFVQYQFIGQLIYEASQISDECLKIVESELFGLAVGGTRTWSHGQPAAEDVQLKDNGRKTAEKFPETHLAHKFYIDVSNYGEERIKEELARDQELEYE